MIEILFLCILAVLVYKTPKELLLFYDTILGKVSTIAILLIIANSCGIPSAIIFILMIVVISNRIEDKNEFINLYDFRKVLKQNKITNVKDANDKTIQNISKFNLSGVPFFNKEREIHKYHNCEEIIQITKKNINLEKN